MIARNERRTPDGWLVLPLVDYKYRSPLRSCNECGGVYHRLELRPGKGRKLGEHPDHQFAPCGHSITHYGSATLVHETPELRREIVDRAGLCRICETILTRQERPFCVCLCCSPVSVGEAAEGVRVAA